MTFSAVGREASYELRGFEWPTRVQSPYQAMSLGCLQ